MLYLKRKIFLALFVSSLLSASNSYDNMVDNKVSSGDLVKTEIEIGNWEAKIGGQIKNASSSIDFENDLGYGNNNNITYLGIATQNNYYYMPNMKFEFFILSQTTNTTLGTDKVFSGKTFDANITSVTKYHSLGVVLYKTFKNQNIAWGIQTDWDIGINIKKVYFSENIESATQNAETTASVYLPLPYLGFSLRDKKTGLFFDAQLSNLSNGDSSVYDYSYAVSYMVHNDLLITLGRKKEKFKHKSGDDAYTFDVEGNFFALKVLF